MWHVRNLVKNWGILWKHEGPPNVSCSTQHDITSEKKAICQSLNPITLHFFHTKPGPKT